MAFSPMVASPFLLLVVSRAGMAVSPASPMLDVVMNFAEFSLVPVRVEFVSPPILTSLVVNQDIRDVFSLQMLDLI